MSVMDGMGSGEGSNPLVSGLTAEVTLVTPEMAKEWLTDAQYAFQRCITQSHVDELARAIEALEWEPTAIKLYHFEGKAHLVDGQHRLTAIYQCGIPAPLVVMRQQASTKNELMNAYRRLDIGKPRDAHIGLIGGGVHEQVGVSKHELKRVIAALRVLLCGFTNVRTGSNEWQLRNRDALARGVYQWQEEARAYFTFTDMASTYQRRRMLPASVFAFAMVTLRYQPAKAKVFWEKVATKSQLERGSGPWLADDVLTSEKLANVERSAKKLASAWNAHYEERTLTGTQVGSSPGVRILGTPYRGKVIREEF